ncbi:hypothetical protein [Mycobacterium hubeiense]|uniref:hypothetical protein n=1 Tax=Mycobacterium hubeiense TaxID=1867256 RepID=UPI00115876E6|nr:hypothetical protein [Mycobacterium sp. QGD 101]
MGAILVSTVTATVMGCTGPGRVISGQPAAATDQMSADRDVWSAAVCEDGTVSTLSTGQIRFPHVENFASCMSAVPGSGGGVVPIIIGEWPDMSTMRQDLDHYTMIRYSAWAELDDGVIVFASLGDSGTTTIEPLTQFGFRIEPLH